MSSRKWKRPEKDDIMKVEMKQVLGRLVGEWQGVGKRIQYFIAENWEDLDTKMYITKCIIHNNTNYI